MEILTEAEINRASAGLEELVVSAGLEALRTDEVAKFARYLELFVRWNQRTNLSAIRDIEGIVSRHFLESIHCARVVPTGVSNLLDFGSGGGLPGVPISILCPEVSVVLAESQIKKATFLNEVVRSLGLNAKVHSARAEGMSQRFEAVTLRAVDKMEQAVESASAMVATGGWMILMTTESDAEKLSQLAGVGFVWGQLVPLAGGMSRVLFCGKRS